uniref:ABC transporter domain-containing protein n=1 Tax=Panagrellus redivivus TaxID=6233 RepID=A0A7E4VR32_PANRE
MTASSPAPAKPPRYNNDNTTVLQFLGSFITCSKLIFFRLDWVVFLTALNFSMPWLSTYLYTYTGDVKGAFVNALTNRDSTAFVKVVFWALKISAFSALTGTVLGQFGKVMGFLYRRNAIMRMQDRYFTALAFYRMNCIDSEGIDNPDGRIAQDAAEIAGIWASHVPGIGGMVAQWVLFSRKVYAFARWHTFLYAIPYFFIITIVKACFFKPLSKWLARSERSENNLRYKHISIRDNAESIAFYKAAKFEQTETRRIFYEFLWQQVRLSLWRVPQNLLANFNSDLNFPLANIIMYGPVFQWHIYDGLTPGQINDDISGSVNQTNIYLAMIEGQSGFFTSLIENAGVLKRVHDFMTFAENVAEESKAVEKAKPTQWNTSFTSILEHKKDNVEVFRFTDVSYGVPTKPDLLLVKNLNLSLRKGESILLSGESGAGKTAFFRILSQIWNIQSGKLSVSRSNIIPVPQLPQRPYLPCGKLTFRQQISYPQRIKKKEINTENDAHILEMITQLDLDPVLQQCGGLDSSIDFEWHERFTPGELQNICFLRVLHKKPALALLDDFTNGVSEEVEARMYALIKDTGIAYVSAGHRESLKKWHDRQLILHGDGGYELVELHH